MRGRDGAKAPGQKRTRQGERVNSGRLAPRLQSATADASHACCSPQLRAPRASVLLGLPATVLHAFPRIAHPDDDLVNAADPPTQVGDLLLHLGEHI